MLSTPFTRQTATSHEFGRSPFDVANATQTGGLLTSLIDTVEPLVREASVPRERHDQATGQHRYHELASVDQQTPDSGPGPYCERILRKAPSSADDFGNSRTPTCRRFGTWTC